MFLVIVWGGLFAVAEGAVRLWVASSGHDLDEMRYYYDWRRTKRLNRTWAFQNRDYPYLPYAPQTKHPDVDMLGLRLTSWEQVKPPDVFRIFCLGGSTTYGGYPVILEEELTPFFAERGLRLEVVNAADLSWTTVETFINFSVRCLYYEPDAIIVYHAQNDAWPAFGVTWRHDYAHWRKRLIENRPMPLDYMPRIADHSALYVYVRERLESQANTQKWVNCMMHYIPDFYNDPYHGVETYRRNIKSLVAVAGAHGVQVLLSTQVWNKDVPEKRLIAAVREVNGITRSFRGQYDHVTVVDAVEAIPGDATLMRDICHFKLDGVGEGMLVAFLARTVREKADEWIDARRAFVRAERSRGEKTVRTADVRNVGVQPGNRPKGGRLHGDDRIADPMH